MNHLNCNLSSTEEEQVKPGFTNYQPQGLAKMIWNSFEKSKVLSVFFGKKTKCQKFENSIKTQLKNH